ncbi:hypothetical protein Tco_0282015 [Tanacetum coccineum]
MLDKIWEYCKDVHRDSTYWWHEYRFEEEERDEMGIEIEKYDPPEVHVETFKVRKDSFKDHGFIGYPFDYRVTLGFGSITGGLDHVNPVIRLPLEREISRVLGLGDHPNPSVGTNPVTASIT